MQTATRSILWRLLVLSWVLSFAGCTASTPPAPAPAPKPDGAAPAQPPASAATNAPLTPLKVGYSAATTAWAQLFVAYEAGLFEKHGFAVELVPLFGTLGAQALVSGEVSVMALGGSTAAPAIIEGADLLIILAAVQRLVAEVYSLPAVESPQALRGKRLAISRPGTLTYFGARLALREWGLRPDEDVAIVSLNDGAGILAGMVGGVVDAGVLTEPNTLMARKQGFHLLADLADFPTEYIGAGVVTTRSYAQENRPLLLRFLRGWIEGAKRYFDDKELAIQAVGKYTREADPDVLEKTYENYAERFFVKIPIPTVRMMQNHLADYAETNPRAGEVDASRTVDPTLVEELRREGFFRSLGLE
jgi:ABC-type nitrate/sulfonate/bicarbonate transport system substrate-binding protein